MNTFATLLLAFPFYLAIKGKLASYVALAKPDASSGAASSQVSASNTPSASGLTMTPSAPSAPAASVAPNPTGMASVVSNVTHIFGDVAAIASV